MKALLLVLFSLLSGPGRAFVCENRGPNVILLTWDGVRSEEFFKGTGLFHNAQLAKSERGEIFKKFWSKYSGQGVVLGKKKNFKIGSDVAVSLPSYQALMTGHSTDCRKNNCPNLTEPSFLESVKSGLGLEKKDVAMFASWDKMNAAAAKDLSAISHGIYPETFNDGSADPVIEKLQSEALRDLPEWHGSRKDKYTFDLGMHYLKKHCPRLLYISLVDSDEFGHRKNYPGYVTALRTYDDYLEQLMTTLEELGEYGKNTTLLLTTDHSRGAGPLWYDHAITPNSEKNVFFYAFGRGIKAQGISKEGGSHLQIKATIESLMGLPASGEILPIVKP